MASRSALGTLRTGIEMAEEEEEGEPPTLEEGAEAAEEEVSLFYILSVILVSCIYTVLLSHCLRTGRGGGGWSGGGGGGWSGGRGGRGGGRGGGGGPRAAKTGAIQDFKGSKVTFDNDSD